MDDIVDKKINNVEAIIKSYINAQSITQSPFFLANRDFLWSQLLLAANSYLDSEAWKDEIGWKKQVSDFLRSYPNEMLLITAMLTTKPEESPWDRVRNISLKLREYSYSEHHDNDGNPV